MEQGIRDRGHERGCERWQQISGLSLNWLRTYVPMGEEKAEKELHLVAVLLSNCCKLL